MTNQIRPIRISGDAAYVPLTQGHEAIIDVADVPLVEGFNWHILVSGRNIYARHKPRCGAGRGVLLHRIIMGDPDGMQIDHIDSDGLNNRRENLRSATHAQNMLNRRINNNNTSGFKGVGWHKSAGRWRARIWVAGKRNDLGYFDSPEEAHASYCRASDKYHGEFGRTE